MSLEEQINIMETQMGNFDTLAHKLQYMCFAFDPDPAFTQAARDVVRANLARTYHE